jgi:hypothetical protein
MELHADDRALAFLSERNDLVWAIDYDVHRCCGGGRICEVVVRPHDAKRQREDHVAAQLPNGTRFLVDPRAVRRLPHQVNLTVRGRRGHSRLDLALSGEEWGDLLYT